MKAPPALKSVWAGLFFVFESSLYFLAHCLGDWVTVSHMLSIGLKCKPTEIFYVVLEITDDTRRILEHQRINLGNNQPLPERLQTSMGRLKTLIERFKALELQGVGMKITEHASLRRGFNEASLHRIYLEGCSQVAVIDCGVRLSTYNANQIKAQLATSQRLEGYADAGEFREIDGMADFPRGTRNDWMDATAAALAIIEGGK